MSIEGIKPHMVFKAGAWRDQPLPPLYERAVQQLRVRVYQLEQDLLRTEKEKGRMLADLESERRQRVDAQSQLQRLLNERATLYQNVMRVWVRVGRWFGVPQDRE
jgi:hypothetical protein